MNVADLDAAAPPRNTTRREEPCRFDIDPEDVRRGLGQLVLTLVRLLHELMERQAVRRAESGTLTDEQIDTLGRTLMLQAEEIERLCEHFGIDPADLNLDLGPLGNLM